MVTGADAAGGEGAGTVAVGCAEGPGDIDVSNSMWLDCTVAYLTAESERMRPLSCTVPVLAPLVVDTQIQCKGSERVQVPAGQGWNLKTQEFLQGRCKD